MVTIAAACEHIKSAALEQFYADHNTLRCARCAVDELRAVREKVADTRQRLRGNSSAPPAGKPRRS